MWYGTLLLATLQLGQAPVALDSVDLPGLLTSVAVPADVASVVRTRTAASWSSEFAYASRGIFVRVALDGTDVGWFLIDTGSNVTVVDGRLVRSRHLVAAGSDFARTATGTVFAPFYQLGDVSVNGATALAITGFAQDLSGFSAPNGEPLAGILGSDFLGGFVVRIDFVTKRVTFSASPSDPSTPGRTAVHFETYRGAPRIPVVLDGHVAASFCIDTGLQGAYEDAPYVVVTDRVWRGLANSYPREGTVRHVSAHGIGAADVTLPVVQIGSLAIQGASVASPWLVPHSRFGSFAPDDALSLLGNGVLEHFSPVTIDYLTRTLYLTVPR